MRTENLSCDDKVRNLPERELPGGFRGSARLRDSGDSGPEGEDQKHFSKLFKMRFTKKLHKKNTKKKVDLPWQIEQAKR